MRRALAGSMDAVRGERAVVVHDVHNIVHVVLLRVAIFLVAAVVLAPFRRARLRPCLAAAIPLTSDAIARTTPRTSSPSMLCWWHPA